MPTNISRLVAAFAVVAALLILTSCKHGIASVGVRSADGNDGGPADAMSQTTSPVSTDGQNKGSLLSAEQFYTREGTDPTFAELLASGVIVPGQRFGKGPVPGSRIIVNNELLAQQTGKLGPIPKNIGIHTQVSGGIPRKDFPNWTRWYQEDGNAQVFRLFQDEQNIRGGVGEDGSPGRVEAFSRALVVEPGTWHEWEGTYTIIEPVGATIFQLFHHGHLWAFHLGMSDEGDIRFNRRRPVPGLEQNIVLAKNMVGKSLSIKIRANGEDYEVHKKAPLEDDDWKLVTTGSYAKAGDNRISFRWGMYCGSRKGHSVRKDAMLFVTGATIR